MLHIFTTVSLSAAGGTLCFCALCSRVLGVALLLDWAVPVHNTCSALDVISTCGHTWIFPPHGARFLPTVSSSYSFLVAKVFFLQSYGAARENSFYFYFCCSILLVLNLVFNVCQSGEKKVFWRRRGKKVKMHHQKQQKKVSNVPLGSCTIRTYRTVFWQEK